MQSDERLVSLTRRGHQAAFSVLVSRYETRLFAFCRHLLRSREDAEDVLQEVFASAFKAMLADDRPITVRPWLYRIARNRCLNHLRRCSAIGVDSIEEHVSEHGLSTSEAVQNREDLWQLVGDIRALPESQRSALLLRELEALSYEQIADVLDKTVPSVKSLPIRARRALAEAAEARSLTCDEVMLDVGECHVNGRAKPSRVVRRHIEECPRCSQLPLPEEALAGVRAWVPWPLAPLFALKKLLFSPFAGSANAGSTATATAAGSTATAAGSTAGTSASAAGASAVGTSATAAGTSATAAGSTAAASAGSTAAGAATAVGAGAAAAPTVVAGSTAGGFLTVGVGGLAGKAAVSLTAIALGVGGAAAVDGGPTNAPKTAPPAATILPSVPARHPIVSIGAHHSTRRLAGGGVTSASAKLAAAKAVAVNTTGSSGPTHALDNAVRGGQAQAVPAVTATTTTPVPPTNPGAGSSVVPVLAAPPPATTVPPGAPSPSSPTSPSPGSSGAEAATGATGASGATGAVGTTGPTGATGTAAVGIPGGLGSSSWSTLGATGGTGTTGTTGA
jgi:RNA polymerase sigma factor (sigma-70 family)